MAYRCQERGTRLQVALSLPLNSMAAALVACGASIASLLDGRIDSEDEHFAMLSRTPRDTPITVLNGDKLRSGWIEGAKKVMGEDCIGYVQHRTHGDERRYLVKRRCLDIQLMPHGMEPFATSKSPFEDPATPQVLESLGAGAAAAAATKFERAAIVFTTVSRMEDDLDERIELSTAGVVPLVDVVRPQRFLSRGVPFRTLIVPSSADHLADDAETHVPVAIFDGAQGYLRLRHWVSATANIVLLDRWEHASPAAVSAFMTDQSGSAPSRGLIGLSPAAGMEMLLFERGNDQTT
jgi:hypothetical protein